MNVAAVQTPPAELVVFYGDPRGLDSMSSIKVSTLGLHPATPQNSEITTKYGTKSLIYLQAGCFASILEDTLAQLEILDQCNNELRIAKIQSEMGHLKSLKYDVIEHDEHPDTLEGVNGQKLDSTINKIKKLDADRKYVKKVLRETYFDLALNNNFDNLTKHLNERDDQEQGIADLIEEEARNRVSRKELIKQLRQQRNHIKTVKYDAEVTIDKLKNEVEDASLLGEIRKRYIENWQNARSEQHIQSIFEIENVPTTNIEYFKSRIVYEDRVHIEIELLVNLMINETLTKVEEWMDKYDTDMEGVDLKIQIKKNQYQDMKERREEYERTLVDHEQAMKEWIEFKDKREKERKYQEKMFNSAIIVQAWWRGLLVRRELGPFRPKKKKKEKKKPLW